MRQDALAFVIEKRLFSVDDAGRVWRVREHRKNRFAEGFVEVEPRLADERLSVNGYRRLQVRFEGTVVSFQAHRLIVSLREGRVIRPDEIVDHVDSDRLNNCPENLALVSWEENQAHAIAVRRLGVDCYANADFTAFLIRDLYAKGVEVEDLADRFSITVETVELVLAGELCPEIPLEDFTGEPE